MRANAARSSLQAMPALRHHSGPHRLRARSYRTSPRRNAPTNEPPACPRPRVAYPITRCRLSVSFRIDPTPFRKRRRRMRGNLVSPAGFRQTGSAEMAAARSRLKCATRDRYSSQFDAFQAGCYWRAVVWRCYSDWIPGALLNLKHWVVCHWLCHWLCQCESKMGCP